jgi:hypothetical protein
MQAKKSKQTSLSLISDDWGRQSTFLQEQFPELTDEDLELEEGNEDELIRRIEIKLNINKNEVVSYLKKSLLATV